MKKTTIASLLIAITLSITPLYAGNGGGGHGGGGGGVGAGACKAKAPDSAESKLRSVEKQVKENTRSKAETAKSSTPGNAPHNGNGGGGSAGNGGGGAGGNNAKPKIQHIGGGGGDVN